MLGPVVIGVEGKQLTPADRRRLVDSRVGMRRNVSPGSAMFKTHAGDGSER